MGALSILSSLSPFIFRPPPPPPQPSTLISLFQLLRRPQTPPPPPLRTFSFFSRALSSTPSPPRSLPRPLQSLSYANSETLSSPDTEQNDAEFDNADEGEEEFEPEEETVSNGASGSQIVVNSSSALSETYKEVLSKLQGLSVKEKKELASYAHSLGKKLKSQQVGKSGVTDSVATALVETLEKNELLKLKVHGSCPGELDDVVKQLEATTGSVVVGRIGRTMILYRPSLTKLEAEEKKKQARRIFVRKQAFKPSVQKEASRLFGHGRQRSRTTRS